MKAVQSENLDREWINDPSAPELWDALRLIEIDLGRGLAELETLAKRGSPLSAMYLGHVNMTGQYGANVNRHLGEKWLRLSADMGSTEARFRLAKYLQEYNRDEGAIILYKLMADQGYMPANFVLGIEYHLGEYVEKDRDLSLHFFRRAEAAGHIHAKHWVSHLLMKDGRILPWLQGAFKKATLLVPMIYYSISRPNSDRLRR